MYKIALCDDDAEFLDKLKYSLETIFSQHGCQIKIFLFSEGGSLIKAIETHGQCFDIILLDVQMPRIDGFCVAERLRTLDGKFILLFTTNIEGGAIEGYKYNAFRYILKKRLRVDLNEAIEKIILKTNHEIDGNESIVFNTVKSSNNGYGTFTVKKKDIIFLELVKRRVRLITVCGEYELLTYPLNKYKEMLSGNNFVIILRAYILNLDYVEGFKQDSFALTCGKTISLGRTRKSITESKEKFLNYYNGRV